MSAFKMVQYCADEESTRTPSDSANNMQFSFPPELLAILTSLQAEVKLLKNNKINYKSNNKSNTNTSNDATINPKTGRTFRCYYWSCGTCPHWARDCNNEKPGHVNDATFKDRKGGSTKGVLGT